MEHELTKEERFNLAISYRVKADLLDMQVTPEQRAHSLKLDITEFNDMLEGKRTWSAYVLYKISYGNLERFSFFAFGRYKTDGSI